MVLVGVIVGVMVIVGVIVGVGVGDSAGVNVDEPFVVTKLKLLLPIVSTVNPLKVLVWFKFPKEPATVYSVVPEICLGSINNLTGIVTVPPVVTPNTSLKVISTVLSTLRDAITEYWETIEPFKYELVIDRLISGLGVLLELKSVSNIVNTLLIAGLTSNSSSSIRNPNIVKV
jgi:hypothetical protein